MTTTARAAPALPPCPACGSTDAIRVVCGYPIDETVEAAERGELRLGGCLVGDESPDYECGGCGRSLPWLEGRADEDAQALVGRPDRHR